MNQSILNLGYCCALLSLTACNQYDSPLCTATNRIDFPNLIGKRIYLEQDSATFEFSMAEAQIERIERGIYKAQEVNASAPTQTWLSAFNLVSDFSKHATRLVDAPLVIAFSVCRNGDRLLAEFEKKPLNGQPRYVSFLLTKSGLSTGFDFIQIGFAPSQLTEKGVTFSVIGDKGNETLDIQNHLLARPDALASLLIPSSATLRFF